MPGKKGEWYAVTGGNLAPGTQHAAREIRDAAMKGLAEAAKDVLELAQDRVPVLDPADESKGRESGKLRDTAKLTEDEARLRVALSFGTPYAAYIHEHMEFRHPDGGQPKYLESAIVESRDAVAQAVAEAIRKVTGD
jgi:Bacteriophage HK97-gp10, putative tail-component